MWWRLTLHFTLRWKQELWKDISLLCFPSYLWRFFISHFARTSLACITHHATITLLISLLRQEGTGPSSPTKHFIFTWRAPMVALFVHFQLLLLSSPLCRMYRNSWRATSSVLCTKKNPLFSPHTALEKCWERNAVGYGLKQQNTCKLHSINVCETSPG